MNFDFTPGQQQLRDSLRSFLAARCSFQARKQAPAAPLGWCPENWRAFAAELGLLGALFPEKMGGAGGGAVELMIVMEELGRALAIEPYLEAIVLAGGLLRRGCASETDSLIASMMAGRLIPCFAWVELEGRDDPAAVDTRAYTVPGGGWRLEGRKSVVAAAPWSTHLIVSARTASATSECGGISLFLCDKRAVGITTSDYPTIDGRRASEVFFDNVRLPPGALIGPLDRALPLIEQCLDEATFAICAEAIGIMSTMLNDSVEYARQRRQFGVPLASFQSLQHSLAQMRIMLEQAISTVYLAALRLEAPVAERSRAVSCAKVTVSKACRLIGQSAIQMHGAMGLTDELAIGHYFKRSTVIERQFGSLDHHVSRFASL